MTRTYLSGFGNEHSSEAIAGALPIGRNSPQQAPRGLYAEKFSGTAFTAPRASNLRSWFYRIRPSVVHGRFHEIDSGHWATAPIADATPTADQLRWSPMPIPDAPRDFVSGLTTMASNGSARLQLGMGVHVYVANRSMSRRVLCNADGEMLVVPQLGRLALHTECGVLDVEPGEIAILPRGLKFRVDLPDGAVRGYVCENHGAPLRLPELGPIGSDGLANRRDFLAPTAAFEDLEGEHELLFKVGGRLFAAALGHSPLDVVAWHGNLAPYKYDLRRFNVIGSISYDHPDPSIFTVLTSPSDTPGTANVDFVVFPPRWLVMEGTFRPPWYHRNVMSEYMGLIYGVYDAKTGGGFVPGASSLHNCMSAHGPDAAAFERASTRELKPEFLGDTMAFMFESRYLIEPTRLAMETPLRQLDYADCWQGLKRRFVPG